MLQSQLFRGDQRLEAAAVDDAAHITPGARGAHVAKIQTALNTLMSAGLATDGVYGQRTADAVLGYKRARRIINTAYQSAPDNIVGRMTIAALDRELSVSIEPVVIIGRPAILSGARPARGLVGASAPGAGQAPLPGVSAVIRGNPFVGRNAVDAGLPPSVPPGHSYSVDVTVTPPLSNGQQIDLEVTGVNGLNGGALVRPAQIDRSQSVIVLGFRQTEPGNAGKLRVEARLNGKVLAVSNAFSVCAHPNRVSCEKKEDLDDGTHKGLVVRVSLESDSGSTSHLDKAEFNELVEEVQRDSPPFSATGNQIVQPNFLPCVAPVPFSDSHGYKPSRSKPGKVVDEQIHIFNCARCGASNIPIPNSGFEITGEVRLAGKALVFSAKKEGTATGVNVRPPGSLVSKSFKSAAGGGKAKSKDFPL